MAVAITLACATTLRAQDAALLKASHASLSASFASSPFRRPLLLQSRETPGGLQGDVYAEVSLPFALAGPALRTADLWCNILMLHLNVKQCSTAPDSGGAKLDLVVGSKHGQPLVDAYHLGFNFKAVKSTSDYLQIRFDAEQGPMGTSHYRILLEVVALSTGRTFLHLSYSYDVNLLARIAMQSYLATAGRHKVGFSVIGHKPDGQPQFIAGALGVLERNTMRYFLAVEAYLDALSLPAAQRFEARLEHWFASTERHAMQLHEMERAEYFALKRGQARLQATPG